MRRTASEVLRELQVRIARLERQARPIDHIQEGYDEMESHPITKTPRGVVQYLEDSGVMEDLYQVGAVVESIDVSEVPSGLKLEIGLLINNESRLRIQGGSSSLAYAEATEVIIVDFNGREKKYTFNRRPISRREYEKRFRAIERVSDLKLVNILD